VGQSGLTGNGLFFDPKAFLGEIRNRDSKTQSPGTRSWISNSGIHNDAIPSYGLLNFQGEFEASVKHPFSTYSNTPPIRYFFGLFNGLNE